MTVFDREREQGRFRGSSGGATREQRGSSEHYGAVQGRSRWEPELAALYPAIAARFIYNNIRSNVAWLSLLLLFG